MTQSPQRQYARRGRLFPQVATTPEEIAQRLAQRAALGERCRQIFEQICPELMPSYYNWFIAIEPETGQYLLDPQLEGLCVQVQTHYPANGQVQLTTFRLNEQGSCGHL